MTKKTIPQMLATAGNYKSYKKTGNNRMHLTYAGGIEAFRLHSTNVATLDRNTGRITLYTGGWITKTTTEAMREGLAMFGVNATLSRQKGVLTLVRNADWNNPIPFEGDSLTIVV
jgi:hypothetical protein